MPSVDFAAAVPTTPEVAGRTSSSAKKEQVVVAKKLSESLSSSATGTAMKKSPTSSLGTKSPKKIMKSARAAKNSTSTSTPSTSKPKTNKNSAMKKATSTSTTKKSGSPKEMQKTMKKPAAAATTSTSSSSEEAPKKTPKNVKNKAPESEESAAIAPSMKRTAIMKKGSAESSSTNNSAPPMKRATPMKKKEETAEETGDQPVKKRKKEKWEGALYRAYGEPKTAIPWPKVTYTPSKTKPHQFKAIAWNVAGLRSFLENRSQQLKDVIAADAPNVIAFMETKIQTLHEEEMKEKLKTLAPEYTVTFNSCTAKKGYSGVGVLTKDAVKISPVIDNFLPNGEKEEEGRLLRLEYPSFITHVVYTPNSGAELDRLDWRIATWDACYRKMISQEKKPVLAIGDFNAAHLDEDIWNLNISPGVEKAAGTTPQERESFGKLLKECNLTDSFRQTVGTHASKGDEALAHFSYWAQRAKNKPLNRGLRLDYCLVSNSWSKKIGSGFILKDYSMQFGDHCPVGVTLNDIF